MTVIDFGAGARDDGYPQDAREAGWYAMQPEAHRFAAPAEPDDYREGFGTRIARLLNYLGAVVSVILMAGLLVWGYRLVTRDVSSVPVIRALAGESRVAPDNPGGEATTHTGLAVNEVPAGVSSAPSPEIAIAPAVAALAEEDVAMGALGATPRTPGALSETAPQPVVAPVIALPDAEAARLAAETRAAEEAVAAATLAAAAEAGTDPAALPPAADAPVDQALTDLDGQPVADQANAINAALVAAAEAPEQAVAPVAASPRPAPRPQRLAAVAPAEPAAPEDAAPEAAAAAPTPKAKPEAAPATKTASADSLPAGSTVVQIGAFDSDELARGEWSRVAGKNGGLFTGKSQIVQKTQKNGRTFWRLRVAGFGSRDEARDFCASLKAAGTDCIPTSTN